MNSDEAEGFWEAMKLEYYTLETVREAWKIVKREVVLEQHKKIYGSTWAFKRKRYPDGRVKKLKARICARGDQQIDGIDVFDTFSPVTNWSTVRLLLTLSVALSMATQQVDYTAAFCQAELPSPVYMEMP